MNYTNQKRPVIDTCKNYVERGFQIPITFTFEHGLFKNSPATRSELIQSKIDKFFEILNREYFRKRKGVLKAEYLASKAGKKRNIEFAFIGFIEHKDSNYHVHGLMRPAIYSTINAALLIQIEKIWKILVSTGRAHVSQHEEKIKLGERHATVNIGIKIVKSDDVSCDRYVEYITKEVQVIGGNMNAEFIFARDI